MKSKYSALVVLVFNILTRIDLNKSRGELFNMAKKMLVSSGSGKLALFFLIVGIAGVIMQFIYLYLPLIQQGAGDAASTADFILSILALAFGGLALVLSVFVIPRNLWIVLVSLVFFCTLIPVIIFAITMRSFPYVMGYAFQMPYMLVLPLDPLMDFIGFWLAIGGSLFAALIGFSAPKK